jgi:hypothetical protein
VGKLTSKTVESLARASDTGKINDGDGLYFQVAKGGSASWIFRYKQHGKSREMDLGSYPAVSLGQARLLAGEQRRILASGIDPLAARDEEREAKRRAGQLAAARKRTFEDLSAAHVQAHGEGWSEKWRSGWLRKLQLHVFPEIGKLSADSIQTEHVLNVLRPIWTTKTRTADEVRGQIEQILDAAKAHGLRQGDNPARWRGHLENLLSKAEKKKARQRTHFTAMHWSDLPKLMAWIMRRYRRLPVERPVGPRSHGSLRTRWQPPGSLASAHFPANPAGIRRPMLDTLYVTSARYGLPVDALITPPQAGAMFRCQPNVRGLPEPRFVGSPSEDRQ